MRRTCAQVRLRHRVLCAILKQLSSRNHPFTKTGSGQASGKLKKRPAFIDFVIALALFAIEELTNIYLRQVWADSEQIANCLEFRGWHDVAPSSQFPAGQEEEEGEGEGEGADSKGMRSTTTPQLLKDLVARWGRGGAAGQQRLVQLLIWATGSDDLLAAEHGHDGATITVEPAPSAAHLPSASTCSRSVTLPPGLGSVEALEEKLVAAFSHTTFGRE